MHSVPWLHLKAFEGVRGTAIKATEGLTILNIVGRHNYALERAIYELRRNNVWMHLIANSVEGHQISLVIRGTNEKKALEVVHSALLGQYKRLNVFASVKDWSAEHLFVRSWRALSM